MLFNSYEFILVFLPIFLMAYFALAKINSTFSKWSIVLFSLVFYSFASIPSLILLLVMTLINYVCSKQLAKKPTKYILWLGIALNLMVLLYFKYANFFISNINALFNTQIASLMLFLPLGISFYLFQLIAYLVDTYRLKTLNNSFLDYLIIVTYFPKLIMGPLVNQQSFIEQFNDKKTFHLNTTNLVIGIQRFVLGLAKKVILADTFALAVNWGFANLSKASALDLFIVAIGYSFQIYFDFSGYIDMGIGVSTMLNIELPENFNSPYQATSIRDFWKRWHMSLTKFFTTYVYIPLGGSRISTSRTLMNTMIVFLVSGLWHGANWTFLLWGFFHGLFSILERLFDKKPWRLPRQISWLLTMMIVTILWVLFRSDSVSQWILFMKGLLRVNHLAISGQLLQQFVTPEISLIFRIFSIPSKFAIVLFLIVSMGVCLFLKNNHKRNYSMNFVSMLTTTILFVWSLTCLSNEAVFVYFNF